MVNIKETQRFFIWLWRGPELQREEEKKEGIEHFCKQMIKLPFKEVGAGDPLSKQDICQGRKSFLQLFTMLRQPVQSQHGLGALPWGSCSLPAACQLRLSYFWDLVPSLEKQTVALTVISNKPPSFYSLNHVFQKSCPTGGLDAKCWVWET